MKPFLLVLALALTAGCAHPRHLAVTTDTTLYEVLSDVHVIEQTVLCGQPSCANMTTRVTPTWTDAKSQKFNQDLLPAVSAGRQFNSLLIGWDPSKPMPAAVQDLIVGLSSALTTITSDFPPGTTRERIITDIARAQSIALNAMTVLLAVKEQ